MILGETREQRLQRVPNIEIAIRYEGWIAEGRYDAYGFVLTCNGSIVAIEAEIEHWEDAIAEAGGQGALGPRASPRIYREGYLAGLREALEIIRTMMRQGKTWPMGWQSPE